MTVWIGPVGQPSTAVEVRSQEPWHQAAVTVHRGLGGRTQTVWPATPADAGARFTIRTNPAALAALLVTLHAPALLEVTTDDPDTCPIQTGVGVVTRTNTLFRYDVAPAAVDVTVDLAYT